MPVCPSCGSTKAAPTGPQGKLAIEVALWACLVVPGALYSRWRRRPRPPACASCGTRLVAQPAMEPLATTQPSTPVAIADARGEGPRRRGPARHG